VPDLTSLRDFIADLGVVAVSEEWYDRHGLRRDPPGSISWVPVVNYISQGDVFAYVGTSDGLPHAVWVERVDRDGDEWVLRVAPDEDAGERLVVRVSPPEPGHRDEAKAWIELRDEGGVGTELKALHEDLTANPPRKPRLGPERKYRAVLVHAMRNDTGELFTAGAIAYGHGEIVAEAYPGVESVADMWNRRIGLATVRPEEFVGNWLERVNGITEELSPVFETAGVDARDAARAALAGANARRDMVISV